MICLIIYHQNQASKSCFSHGSRIQSRHSVDNKLVEEENVEVRRLPDDVLTQLKSLSQEVIEELASNMPHFSIRLYCNARRNKSISDSIFNFSNALVR